MAKVINIKTGKTKTVKDLGWLLRHAKDAKAVNLFPQHYFAYPKKDYDCKLCVDLKDGLFFQADFTDKEIAKQWIKRPSLSHCSVFICNDLL